MQAATRRRDGEKRCHSTVAANDRSVEIVHGFSDAVDPARPIQRLRPNLAAAVGFRNIEGGAESIAERSSLLLGHKTHYSG
jgi:hypothetical protein